MPYSITTKDGITINNIPDDIAPDAQVLRDRVAQERAKLNGVDQESAPQQSGHADAADAPPVDPQNITQFRPREEIMKELSLNQSTMRRSNKDENLANILSLQGELKSRDDFTKSTRAAKELPEIGSELGIKNLLPDADFKTQALVSAALVSAADPQEISKILKSASPDIGISQDEAGNLANNRTGQQAIINRPGASGLDVGQFVGRAAAFSPSGAAGTSARMIGGGMATEAALQGVESAAGGEFNPEAILTEGAASVVGLGIGRALRGTTPDQIKKGLVRDKLLERLDSGDASKELLGKKSVGGKVFESPIFAAINKAKRQGFDERVLRSIETANPETKDVQRKILKILKTRSQNADYAAKFRSSDPMGAGVFKRYKELNKLRQKAGNELNVIAKTKLSKVAVDASDNVDSFYDGLKDLGVRFRERNGRIIPVFNQMDDVNEAGAKRVLSKVLPRLQKSMTGQQAHKLKKLIDSSVSYDGLPTSDTALPKALESSLKSLRSSLNDKIGKGSSEYADANAKFAQVIEPLSQMDKVFKSMLDLSSEEAVETGIGTKAARTLMSNNVTRGKMLDLLEQGDKVLSANNVVFKDDLIKQAVFIDEMERMFGSEASASFTGASKRAAEQASLEAAGSAMGVPLELIRSSIEAAKGVSRENAIKALESILR
jgi:hypothetical protein